MAFSKTNTEHMKALKAGLDHIKPADFVLTNSGTFANQAVRVVSDTDYGHALLYMGRIYRKDAFLELPIMLHAPSEIFNHDGCSKAAFVQGKRLSDKQRSAIVDYAKSYYEAKKDSSVRSYDIVGTGYQAAAKLAVTTATTFNPALKLLNDRAEQELTALANVPLTFRNELFSFLSDHPSVNCAGLITWCHAKADHIIDEAKLSRPHTSSPKQLWEAVKAHPGRYDAQTYHFD